MSLQAIRRASRVDSIPLGLARMRTGDLELSQLHESNNTVGDIHAAGQARIHIGTNISTYLQNPYDEPIRLFQTWLNDEDNVDLVFELADALGRDNHNEADSIGQSNGKFKDQNEKLETLFKYMSLQDGRCSTSNPSLAKFQRDASTQQQADLEALLEYWRPGGISESDSLPLQKSAAKRMQFLLTSKKKEYEVEIRQSIFKWLVPPSMTDKMFEESLQTRLQGTCDWVFQQSAFESWRSTTDGDNNTPKVLWINGIAGSGKTVLCAKIVEHLKTNLKTPVGYFFLADSIGFTDPFMALRIWLFHMLSDQDAFDIIRRTWRKQRDNIPTQGAIRDLFEKVVQHVSECTFILDGLDECGPSNEASLSTKTSMVDEFLQSLWQAVNGTTTRILMTSRKDSDIQQNFDTQPDIAWFEHEISGQDVGGDIDAYAASIVERLLAKKSQKLKDEIIQLMIERCDGQILWLRLLELALESGGKEPARIKAIILQTPSKLRDVYKRNWRAIQCLEPYDSARAINLLRWVVFAIRPLTVCEVIEALAIDDEDIEDFPLDYMPDAIDEDVVNGLISICNGLIEIPPGGSDDQCQDWILQLPHYSVKEYVLGQFNKSSSLQFFDKKAAAKTEEEQNMHLAMACLRYISFPSVWSEDESETSSCEQGLGQMFREYASTYWHQHIKSNRRNDSDLTKMINKFFSVSNSTWGAWEKWFSIHEQLLMYNEKTESGSRIHYACRLGLLETVRYLLLQQPEGVNSKTSSRKTGLLMACEQGHTDIADLLMSFEADIEACSIDGCTPLYFASMGNHISIVKNLICHGASTSIADGRGRTPLLAACIRGSNDVVAFLLASNADPTVPTNNGWTPLNVAATEGHTDIVRLLLEQTVDLHAPTIEGRTPIYNASLKGHKEIVHLLLEFGAQPQVGTNTGWTPLMAASSTGHLAVTKYLLQHGADLSSSNNDGVQALYLASRDGYQEIAQCLLEKGADPNAVCANGWRPIHASAEFGHLQVTRLLQAHGANIHARSESGATALCLAVLRAHVEVVCFLIEQGADINTKDGKGWQPLHTSCELGHLQVTRLLIDHGADIHARSESGGTPLFLAALKGHAEVVHFLISQGADVDARQGKYWKPIHASSEFGHLEVTRMLHGHGADIQARGGPGRTPLYLAAARGQTDIIRFLIQQGADVSAADRDGWQAIHTASENGHIEVISLLLDQGADIQSRSVNGRIPLHSAAVGRHVDVAQLLIQRGANVNTADKGGGLPIHVACGRGHLDMVKFLTEHGAIFDAQTNEGVVPMLCAVGKGHVDVARFLIEKGVDLSTKAPDGSGLLHVAAENGHVELVKLLLDNGAFMQARDNMKRTPFFMAVKQGHMEIAKLLLDRGVKEELLHDSEAPAIVAASLNDQVEMMRWLIDLGADATVQREDGLAALHFASMHGHYKAVSLLLDSGVDVEARAFGATALIYAAYQDDLDVATLLLEHDADVSSKDSKGRSSLRCASDLDSPDMARLLIEHGANVSDRDDEGMTPLYAAMEGDNVDLVELLIEYDALDSLDHENNHTPLYISAMFNAPESARFLLDLGGDVSVTSLDGTTPLHVAAAMGSLEIVQMFMQHIDDTPHQTKLAVASVKDKLERTAFFYASALGYLEVAKLLLPFTDSSDTSDVYGYTPLLLAVRHSHTDVVEWLLGQGKVVVNQDVYLGHSLLWWSSQAGYAYTTELLLQHSGMQLCCSKPDPTVGLPHRGYCDGCLAKQKDMYRCRVCSGGGFVPCKPCYESGIRCFNASHELVRKG